MMENFNLAFEQLIGIEGGYVNDPADRGGETKYGISKRAFPNENIKELSLDRAKSIYYTYYWNSRYMDLDKFDYSIALELFDTAVNMGVRTASRMLQEALNLLNRNQRNFKDLHIDGRIGPATLSAYSKVDKDILLKVLNGLQFTKYRDIVFANPAQEKFFNGWMKRV
ncbi:glycoside hydrolase family 108 protein [Leeuwenhoekiella sp. A16]|uniref:glycoside hydrolase family 108 protein n=1 Tax=Leeuwenhoekiella sp. A16 TaxID=3141462 RepID=UPI003A80ACAD